MDAAVFLNISKIIERDSKSTTYKFALLRGVIDIISENSPYIVVEDETVRMPLGLMIERWLLYYYPIFDSAVTISQINGAQSKLAFQEEFLPVINYYKTRGGLSAFYNDLRRDGVSLEIAPAFVALAKKLKDTITRMPMRYIGRSITDDYYSIFHYTPAVKTTSRRGPFTTAWLIETGGTFSIPRDYFDAFRLLGSFLSGTDSILFKWAEFSVSASGSTLSPQHVLEEVLKSPITDRDVAEAKKLYASILREAGHVKCVWTGAEVNRYDIDHVIPFAIWKNNDLWNLLPARPSVNNSKRHKIPTAVTLGARKDAILEYWNLLQRRQPQRFAGGLQLSLLGGESGADWPAAAFAQLERTADYLIHTRGYEPWTL